MIISCFNSTFLVQYINMGWSFAYFHYVSGKFCAKWLG